MEERWFGKAFQIFEAADENDLEAAIVSPGQVGSGQRFASSGPRKVTRGQL